MALLETVPDPKVGGQRRLLALDGGGIRGVVALEVLAEFEAMLRREHDDDTIVLSDYFDYFGGTSTGALIATLLARGWPVDALMQFYVADGATLFDRVGMIRRIALLFRYKYNSRKLTHYVQQKVGKDTLFGDADFRSLLMAVLHNSTSDSPWPLSNNPHAKYNNTSLADCNTRLPLWQVVRASTAAPVYFPPETAKLGDHQVVFVDGGITPFNNPAFQLYLQATQPAYGLEWATGHDKLLLVSVGTGRAPNEQPGLIARRMNLLHTAKTLPGTLMNGASALQDVACRSIGHCVYGAPIDGELGDMTSDSDGHDPQERHFTYARFDATLTPAGLTELGLADLAEPDTIDQLAKLDAIDNIDDLRRVGRAVAAGVTPELFADFCGVATLRTGARLPA